MAGQAALGSLDMTSRITGLPPLRTGVASAGHVPTENVLPGELMKYRKLFLLNQIERVADAKEFARFRRSDTRVGSQPVKMVEASRR